MKTFWQKVRLLASLTRIVFFPSNLLGRVILELVKGDIYGRAYDILGSLRGMDSLGSGSKFKYAYVMRLRRWLSLSYFQRDDPIDKSYQEKLLAESRLSTEPPWWGHWRDHMNRALLAVGMLEPSLRDEAGELLALSREVEWSRDDGA